VGVRLAAVTRDGVDRLDLLRAHLEQEFLSLGHDLTLAHTRAQHPVDVVIHRVDDAGRLIEQCDLVLGLDLARLLHHRRGVGHRETAALQRGQRLHVGEVDAEPAVEQSELTQLLVHVAGQQVRHAGRLGHRAAHRGHARAPAGGGQPRREQLMVLGRRAEVPQDRFALAGQQHAARALVPGPLTDVGAGDVPDVVLVKQQDGGQLGGAQRLAGLLQPLAPQTPEVDPLLPVHRHRRSA
jgi:hypothetical protein